MVRGTANSLVRVPRNDGIPLDRDTDGTDVLAHANSGEHFTLSLGKSPTIYSGSEEKPKPVCLHQHIPPLFRIEDMNLLRRGFGRLSPLRESKD